MSQKTTYDAFGSPIPRGGAWGGTNPWLYTGEQRDSESGMYYLRARYYDPAVGRFLSRDPIPFLQRYAYVGGNPVNLTDPSGAYAMVPPLRGEKLVCSGEAEWDVDTWGIVNDPKKQGAGAGAADRFEVQADITIKILNRNARVDATVLCGDARFITHLDIEHNIGDQREYKRADMANMGFPLEDALTEPGFVAYGLTDSYTLKSGQYPVEVDVYIGPDFWSDAVKAKWRPHWYEIPLQCERRR